MTTEQPVPERYRLVTDDLGLLRALAHPARLAILTRLQAEGPATATECAEVAGLSPSACSYHLRTLAKHGMVEDAPARGDGRERVWRALQRGWVLRDPDEGELTPDLLAAQSAVIETVLADAQARLSDYLGQSARESSEWRTAATLTHTVLLADADELREIAARISEILDPYRVVSRDPDEAPTGARLAEAHLRLFPRPPRAGRRK
ncbi:transcriptional regulator [Acrocarpospora phusangensis]|uniref:Transcriptional regulator n=1 Tax=Acrocarpospora phusangensis TaxID=1070424 RepID=A0A919QH90_9ACTN|nr:helix-turn-helix domain-containing protein [Acrocarpospora phusangensis]GIH27538.1 transcriptional regulator [Acrocarpospora phusangensis]